MRDPTAAIPAEKIETDGPILVAAIAELALERGRKSNGLKLVGRRE